MAAASSTSISSLLSSDRSLRSFLQARASKIVSSLAAKHPAIGSLFKSKLPHIDDHRISLQSFSSSSHARGAPLNLLMDHTLLRADASFQEVKNLIDEAFEYQFYSVCLNGSRVGQAFKYIQQKKQSLPPSSHVPLIAAVLSFPLGASSVAVKRAECAHIIADGAGEIDMVINIGALKEGDYQTILNEIEAVVQVAATKNVIVKVIFETCLLNAEQIVDASILSVLAGAQFIKTSTGFSTGGATAEAVKLMRQTVGRSCSVKASGGIRDKKTALAMVEAGANRLGVSASVAIIKDSGSSKPSSPSSTSSIRSSY